MELAFALLIAWLYYDFLLYWFANKTTSLLEQLSCCLLERNTVASIVISVLMS